MPAASVTRLPVVGVLGSGVEAHEPRAVAVGRWIALEGAHLLTGGGRGVMTAASRAFCETPGRRGLSIGVLPSASAEAPQLPPDGYPNPWIEIPVHTHLPLSGARGTDLLSRNHINVLSADVLIALPGGPGTASEVALALAYGRPLVAHLDDRAQIPDLPDAVCVEPDFERVKRFVRARLAPRAAARGRTG